MKLYLIVANNDSNPQRFSGVTRATLLTEDILCLVYKFHVVV